MDELYLSLVHHSHSSCREGGGEVVGDDGDDGEGIIRNSNILR